MRTLRPEVADIRAAKNWAADELPTEFLGLLFEDGWAIWSAEVVDGLRRKRIGLQIPCFQHVIERVNRHDGLLFGRASTALSFRNVECRHVDTRVPNLVVLYFRGEATLECEDCARSPPPVAR